MYKDRRLVREWRLGLEISTTGLSRRLGWSKPTYWKWENDHMELSDRSISQLSSLSGVSPMVFYESRARRRSRRVAC